MFPRLAVIISLVAGSFCGLAQSVDSLLNKLPAEGVPGDTLLNKLPTDLSQADTLVQDRLQKLDSVQNSALGAVENATTMPDSLLKGPQQRLDSIQGAAAGAFGGLKNSYDSVTSVADRASARIQQRIDSLSALNLPTGRLTNRLDSVGQWKEEKLGAIRDKTENLKSKLTAKIDSLDLPDEVKEKAGALTSKIDQIDVSLPADKLPDLSLNDKIPGLNTAGVDVPGLDVPGVDMPGLDNPLGDQSIPGVQGVDNPLGDASVPGVPEVEMPGEIGEVTGQVKQVQDQVGEVVPDNVDDIPGALEEQAGRVDEVGAMQDQIGEVDKLRESMGNVQDPEAMKEQVKTEVKKQAVNHFAGKEEQLKAAMEKMAEYKKKYSSVQSLADLPKKRPNEMRGKPFIERLVPGIALQIHRRDAWMVDFNPYVGYRFNGRLTAGIGWNQRVAYNTDDNAFDAQFRIYGPRAYGEFKVGKGFSGHLDVEYMNTWVPPRFSSNPDDPEGREWVFSTMAGLKKEYRFIKKVKGTLYILYNLYDPKHRSPYADKLNMRIGFEFPMKKKK